MNKKIIIRENFNFEKDVINIILDLIKKHQIYLTQKENLPQLAKLGYIYHTLWHAGSICWSSNGLILNKNNNSCENNSKYKIEICKPRNKTIGDLIYGAWGMHVSNDFITPTFKKFCQIIIEGEELNNLEIKKIKPNKTFNEWCEILMDKKNPYPFETKKEVIDYLLFIIGNEYNYNKETGYIFQKANGTNQDITIYGDWKNAFFNQNIKETIIKLLKTPEVKNTVDIAHNHELKIFKAKKNISEEWSSKLSSSKEQKKTKEILKNTKQFFESKEYRYYPISAYSLITQFDDKTHSSYIEAGIEACEDIIIRSEHQEQTNINFAFKFLKTYEMEKVIKAAIKCPNENIYLG